MEDKIVGALIGLACGDAVGTTLEFKPRGTFEPLADMIGGGPFRLQPGQWTDDMSMALCLAHSLIHKQGFDPVDQMNRYCNWYQHGYMSSTGHCFDIGMTVSAALNKYLRTHDPFAGSVEEHSSGNGSLMRLAPIPMVYHSDIEACIHFAGESSRTTHGSAECVDSSRLFASLIFQAFRTEDKSAIFERNTYNPSSEKVVNLANRDFLNKGYQDLTGSGYVIESLESALWCFMNGTSFEECILLAANIGNDADTTAAICGQIAGAYYGVSNIPERWVSKLTLSGDIKDVGRALMRVSNSAEDFYQCKT